MGKKHELSPIFAGIHSVSCMVVPPLELYDNAQHHGLLNHFRTVARELLEATGGVYAKTPDINFQYLGFDRRFGVCAVLSTACADRRRR